MKLVLPFLLFSAATWAKPTVLVSYFDAYGKAKVNNSETVANLLVAKGGRNYEISLCKLETKFDVSFDQLKACLDSLPERPALVVSLGETGCDLKIEMMGRNLDKTFGPDNAGVQRKNTPIVAGAPAAFGLTYPLADMYCALDSVQKKETIISNNAGSFVCNNLAYQTAWFLTDLQFGFIHVPAHNCSNLTRKNERVVTALHAMITRGVEIVTENPMIVRLPVLKSEFSLLRGDQSKEKCVNSFWRSARAFDEKKRFPF